MIRFVSEFWGSGLGVQGSALGAITVSVAFHGLELGFL